MTCCRSSLLISEGFRLPYAASTLACAACSSRRICRDLLRRELLLRQGQSWHGKPGCDQQHGRSAGHDGSSEGCLNLGGAGAPGQSARWPTPSLAQPVLAPRAASVGLRALLPRLDAARREVRPVRVCLHQPTQLLADAAGLLRHRAPAPGTTASRTAPSAAVPRAAPRLRRSGSRPCRPPVPPAWDSRQHQGQQGKARSSHGPPLCAVPPPASSALSARRGGCAVGQGPEGASR